MKRGSLKIAAQTIDLVLIQFLECGNRFRRHRCQFSQPDFYACSSRSYLYRLRHKCMNLYKWAYAHGLRDSELPFREVRNMRGHSAKVTSL